MSISLSIHIYGTFCDNKHETYNDRKHVHLMFGYLTLIKDLLDIKNVCNIITEGIGFIHLLYNKEHVEKINTCVTKDLIR